MADTFNFRIIIEQITIIKIVQHTTFVSRGTDYNSNSPFVCGLSIGNSKKKSIMNGRHSEVGFQRTLYFQKNFACSASVQLVACENSRFSSLFAAGDVYSSRNVLSGEERGETAVFAGYIASHLPQKGSTQHWCERVEPLAI